MYTWIHKPTLPARSLLHCSAQVSNDSGDAVAAGTLKAFIDEHIPVESDREQRVRRRRRRRRKKRKREQVKEQLKGAVSRRSVLIQSL
jgi:hypothetical protein